MAIWSFRKKRKINAARSVSPIVVDDRAQSRTWAQGPPSRPSSRLSTRKTMQDVEVESPPPLPTSPSSKNDRNDHHVSSSSGHARTGSRSVPDLPRTRGGDDNDVVVAARPEEPPRSPIRPSRDHNIPSYHLRNPTSAVSLASNRRPDLSLLPPPTLHAKRSANDSIVRRRSSKKNKRDHKREREIKSMSAPPIPASVLLRPVTSSSPSSKSGSRHGPVDWRRTFTERNRSAPQIERGERPTSEIMDPDLGPISSLISSTSGRPAYKVRSLDILAPRPTIKCANPRRDLLSEGADRKRSRSGSQPKKPALALDDTFNQRRRVDDLADRLDAGELRELMERDQRRRERKRKVDEARIEQQQQQSPPQHGRRAERRRGDDPTASRKEVGMDETTTKDRTGFRPEFPRFDLERCKGGREDDVRRGSVNQSPLSWLHDPSVERFPPTSPTAEVVAMKPATSKEAETEVPTPTDDQEEAVVATAKAVRLSQASMSPPGSPKPMIRPTSTISQVTDTMRERTERTPEPSEVETRPSPSTPDPRRASSGVAAGGGGGSGSTNGTWMTFFRRSVVGTKAKRDSSEQGRRTPSEFSNTSRDSLSRQAFPPSARTSFQRRSGTPVRTTSKFREELPELPISPPDSRLHSPVPVSPEDSTVRDAVGADGSKGGGGGGGGAGGAVSVGGRSPLMATAPISPARLTGRDDHPVHRHRSIEAPSIEGKANSAAISQSMASIDSEGSWLSGKPTKRTSQTQPFALRHSTSSLRPEMMASSDSGEEFAVVDDEYFTRLTPAGEQDDWQLGQRQRKPSSAAMGSSESEGEANVIRGGSREHGKWHGGVARHPTVVHHANRIRSREGLLNDSYHHHRQADLVRRPNALNDEGGGGGANESENNSPLSDTTRPSLVGDDLGGVSPTVDVDQGTRQHLRHVSVGSARLLEIAPRLSVEHRRQGSGSTQEEMTG